MSAVKSQTVLSKLVESGRERVRVDDYDIVLENDHHFVWQAEGVKAECPPREIPLVDHIEALQLIYSEEAVRSDCEYSTRNIVDPNWLWLLIVARSDPLLY